VSSDEEIEQAVRDSFQSHGEHNAKLVAYEENRMQNMELDNWLEAVAGVHDVEVKKEQDGTPSNVTDKKGKNVVIYISDEED
jgi:hypothetical protein